MFRGFIRDGRSIKALKRSRGAQAASLRTFGSRMPTNTKGSFHFPSPDCLAIPTMVVVKTAVATLFKELKIIALFDGASF
jgi:hypothetical protein